MKRTMCLLVLFCAAVVNAKIITVDNKFPSIGDYSTLSEAHAAASSGDTIFVYPSPLLYSGIDVIKPLTFIGVGFELSLSEDGVFNTKVTNMSFESGSDGSVIDGLECTSGIRVLANNLTVKRNKTPYIRIYENHTGTIISQNIISNDNSPGTSPVYIESFNSVTITNNIIIVASWNAPTVGAIISESDCFTTILNNVVKVGSPNGPAINVQGESHITNNILVRGGIFFAGGEILQNNMSNTATLPAGNGNLNNIDMSTVFVDYENNDYHLLPDSPARGAGLDGVDMGVYGGNSPFVDGGFPGLPAIIGLQAPSIVIQEEGLNVNIKAKSNKQ